MPLLSVWRRCPTWLTGGIRCCFKRSLRVVLNFGYRPRTNAGQERRASFAVPMLLTSAFGDFWGEGREMSIHLEENSETLARFIDDLVV